MYSEMSIPFSKHSSDISVIDISYNNSHLVAVIILWVKLLNILLRLFSLPYVCLMPSQVKQNESKLASYRIWRGKLEKEYSLSISGNTAGLGMRVFRCMIEQYMLENFFFIIDAVDW